MDLNKKDQILFGEGSVFHSRPSATVRNSFNYRIFNVLIPIHDEFESEKLNKRFGFSIRAQDYLEGRSGSIKKSIEDFLNKNLNYHCEKIWLQTLPRIFGYAFNPVSFWYCYKNEKLDAILCEVNNTFGDRHFYFIENFENKISYKADKNFHVSPFFPVDGFYRFEFDKKDRSSEARIRFYQKSSMNLDTWIRLDFKIFTEVSFPYFIKNYGFMTLMVILRIHLQALRLWMKGAQFFHRPSPSQKIITYAYAENAEDLNET